MTTSAPPAVEKQPAVRHFSLRRPFVGSDSTEPLPTARCAFEPYEHYNSGFLDVSELHRIYYEEAGNRDGIPLLFLHGGPGGAIRAKDRQLFDSTRFRVILFDQRGCGKSTPFGETKDNTTWDLCDDMERLRRHLHVERWIIFGGSWGSLLAIVYAIQHRESVSGLVIWGIYFGTDEENRWIQEPSGVANLLPDHFERFESLVPVEERNDLTAAYCKRIFGSDPAVALEFSKAWTQWEFQACRLGHAPFSSPDDDSEEARRWAISMARIETHYFRNQAFLHGTNNEHYLQERARYHTTRNSIPTWPTSTNDLPDNYILSQLPALAGLPAYAVQGRLDLVCPLRVAWQLKKRWPSLRLTVVDEGIHSSSDEAMLTCLLNVIDACADDVVAAGDSSSSLTRKFVEEVTPSDVSKRARPSAEVDVNSTRQQQ